MPTLRRLPLAGILALSACGISPFRTNPAPDPARPPKAAATFAHARLDRLLRRHVGPDGLVDYRGLLAERSELDAYLAELAQVDPERLRDDAERKAYWINAYNAITLAGILHFYPTRSVRDHPGFWTRILTNCGARDVSLDDIEHRILRPMGDPRIHVAIVCASRSCPKLRPRAYRGADLDETLDRAAREFLADPTRNRFDDKTRTAHLSRIFDWFANDFEVAPYGGVRGFVRRFAPPRPWLRGAFRIRWRPYDWRLNERQRPTTTARPLRLDDFERAPDPAGRLAGWREQRFLGTAPTRYERRQEHGDGYLHAEADGAASMLVRLLDLDPTRHPRLAWRWRVLRLPAGGDLARRATDDCGARVLVGFGTPGSRPDHALCYVWACHTPTGTVLPNAFSDRTRMIVLRSGPAELGRWLDEARDVAADHRRAFGRTAPTITAVAVMVDADQTGSRAEADFDGFRMGPAAR